MLCVFHSKTGTSRNKQASSPTSMDVERKRGKRKIERRAKRERKEFEQNPSNKTTLTPKYYGSTGWCAVPNLASVLIHLGSVKKNPLACR